MGWQDLVAIGVVLGAVVYLSSLGWRGLIGGKSGGCGTSCGKCSTGDGKTDDVAARPEQLVSIGLPRGASTAGQAAPNRVERSEIP